MKLLCIGDVISKEGIACFEEKLPMLKRRYSPDLVIVNGENSALGNGIDKTSYDALMSAGADIVTGGNHSFQKKTAPDLHDESQRLVRPVNVLGFTGGKGDLTLDTGRVLLRVINLSGSLFMRECENPFKCMDKLLETDTDAITVVDFHAEATGEKQALGYYLDGRVSLVYGTHTHVQTADERITENGTGYITDIGMTGVYNSVIGKDVATCVHNFAEPEARIPVKDAKGGCVLCGIFCEIDNQSKRCIKIERIQI